MSADNNRKKTSSGKTKNSNAKKSSQSKNSSKTRNSKKNSSAKNKQSQVKTMPKSATVLAIERQQRLEKTMPLGQLTTELPVLGRTLDGPDRRPWKHIKFPKLNFEWNPKKHLKLFILLGVLLVLIAIALGVISNYTVSTVTIEGNVHYTNDEIYNIVIGDNKLGTNSIYLSMKYKNKTIEDIPFIQTMDVKIVDSKTIKITVYEKALAGYVEYLGRYFYFDKDGTVVESTNIMTTGIPQVMGLSFDHIVLYEKLPLENEEIFGHILEMTQLLEKYDIEMDKIYFDKNYDMTLYFGDARISIGSFENIDEKIIKLKNILPELKGKSGVLRLDNYSGVDSVITFELDS